MSASHDSELKALGTESRSTTASQELRNPTKQAYQAVVGMRDLNDRLIPSSFTACRALAAKKININQYHLGQGQP